MKFNTLEAYAHAGASAGRASKNRDYSLCRFQTEWMRKATRLETPEYAAQARAAFAEAYAAAYPAPTVERFK